MIKFYIDADACPVMDIALKISKEYSIEATLICDTSHEISRPGIQTIIVSKGADSADFALVNLITPGDIALTQDYGLASMCLGKRAYVINQNGLEYTNENIVYLMEYRHDAKKLRSNGKRLKGPKPRTKEDNDRFEKGFRNLLERVTNQNF